MNLANKLKKLTKISCAGCGCTDEKDNMLKKYDEWFCVECASICEECGLVRFREDMVPVTFSKNNVRYICRICAISDNYSIFRCRECENYFGNDYYWGSYNGQAICENCSKNYSICDCCDYVYYSDEVRYVNGQYLCCDCYEQEENMDDIINDYCYKPKPIFYGTSKSKCFLGVELEVDNTDGSGDISKIRNVAYELSADYNNYIYLKHDGSLSPFGFEIVSHPMNLDYHTNSFNWERILSICIESGLRSHYTSTCGFHLHVSRDFFGISEEEQDLNIAKLMLLVSKFFESHIFKFSRRKLEELIRWAKKPCFEYEQNDDETSVISKMKYSKSLGRYQAINLQNKNTVEFRLFKGTLKYKTFIASLQFVVQISEFAKKIKLQEIPTTKWSDIFMQSKFKELNDYLNEKGLVD